MFTIDEFNKSVNSIEFREYDPSKNNKFIENFLGGAYNNVYYSYNNSV